MYKPTPQTLFHVHPIPADDPWHTLLTAPDKQFRGVSWHMLDNPDVLTLIAHRLSRLPPHMPNDLLQLRLIQEVQHFMQTNTVPLVWLPEHDAAVDPEVPAWLTEHWYERYPQPQLLPGLPFARPRKSNARDLTGRNCGYSWQARYPMPNKHWAIQCSHCGASKRAETRKAAIRDLGPCSCLKSDPSFNAQEYESNIQL